MCSRHLYRHLYRHVLPHLAGRGRRRRARDVGRDPRQADACAIFIERSMKKKNACRTPPARPAALKSILPVICYAGLASMYTAVYSCVHTAVAVREYEYISVTQLY